MKIVNLIIFIFSNRPTKSIKKISAILRGPSSWLLVSLLSILYSPLILLDRIRAGNKVTVKDKSFLAIYDLKSNPATFDFSFFLIDAEIHASKVGCSDFDVIILEKQSDGFISRDASYNKIMDEISQQWRIKNLLLPITTLHKKIRNISVYNPKHNLVDILNSYNFIYPKEYSKFLSPPFFYEKAIPRLNVSKFTGFEADNYALDAVADWQKSVQIEGNQISITLRNYGYDTSRNSDFKIWKNFADYLTKKGYSVVFIPDTENCFVEVSELQDNLIFTPASWNLQLRLALYEKSVLNFVTGGPATLCQLSKKIKYISTNFLVPGSIQCKETVFKRWGLEIGQKSFGFAETGQWIYWEEENLEKLVEVFESYEKLFISADYSKKET